MSHLLYISFVNWYHILYIPSYSTFEYYSRIASEFDLVYTDCYNRIQLNESNNEISFNLEVNWNEQGVPRNEIYNLKLGISRISCFSSNKNKWNLTKISIIIAMCYIQDKQKFLLLTQAKCSQTWNIWWKPVWISNRI